MNTSSPQHGLFYQLDPRVKIVTVLLLVIGIAVTPNYAWLAYPLIWTVLGGVAVLSEIPIWRIVKLAGIALPFTLAALPLMVTLHGNPLGVLFGATITDVGVAAFLSVVLKSWLSAHAVLLLTLTTSFTDLLWGLACLGVPAVLVSMMSMMYRYLYALRDEGERLLRARAARSGATHPARSGGRLFWRARVVGNMVGNLFLRSYERSERVYAAMLARGYDGSLKSPTAIPPLTLTSIRVGATPVVILLLIQIIVRL